MRRSKRGAVDPFIVMDVLAEAQAAEAAGRSVIHMEVGQPGTPAPEAARRAVAEALEAGPLGYTVALGLPALRARIARLYAEWYGVVLDPARVVVTSGSSAGFVLAFTALFDAGERVGLGVPGYPSYRSILRALSLEPVGLPTEAPAHALAPDRVTADLDGLIVASPNNPTGSMLGRDAMAALADRCAETGTALVSDEIYHGLHHRDRAVTALEVTDEAIVVNSFSKYFSMTGWRVGWLVVPEGMVRTVERLAQNLFICAPHASQVAALAAMDAGAELEANRAVYAANRRLVVDGLRGAGLDFASPDGAFYVYADVSRLTDDSRAFCRDLLDAGVAATPGLDFDPERGARTVRLSYARSTGEVAEGVRRIVAFLGARA